MVGNNLVEELVANIQEGRIEVVVKMGYFSEAYLVENKMIRQIRENKYLYSV